ncbi:coagulation factor XIII A chain [Rhinichthys klamathensis goyatoka]|uniref:coagulation factor XIII A chain n=1 Tax=Rhinichthys klamathensis goyatoka TaxID=3034132 RepID=UPI0024B5578C|nr:coagulation factor XIII A chain [Rhinichthys klamathensis goyatoka]XP_056090730.1 coagulation factor XIII A chain [Rhinichthys klamathensis goyatoka]
MATTPVPAMADQESREDPPPAAAAPAAVRPKRVSHRGRSAGARASSNQQEGKVEEFEPFMLMPRGPPPLNEYLDVWDVDVLKRPQDLNKQEHHTHLYSSDFLIVRRAQEFQIKITFNRPYKPAEDKFALEFVIGPSPQYSKGTYIPVFPTADRQSVWRGRVVETSDNVVTMGITPSPECIVGKYVIYIGVVTPYGIRRTRRDPSTDVYILFNPWSSADAVFLDDEEEREECVMNELGIIYHGAYDDVSERAWNYGQFEFGVLDACLFILDKADMPLSNRGDIIKVTRVASAMLNSRDDDGVLVGNWSGDYTYGVPPTSWTGSVEILLDYANSRGTPVCYAQCWVYAAVFNSFLRSLGIPSRVVTNFFSAHDNDGNLKMDIILDENGKLDRNRTKDSIWNYHCWNECYMARPDLPSGFGGWQVVDATPQETSDGMFRCGPASVAAIKHGQICYPFDAPFVFAEVNSDVVFYRRHKDGTLDAVKVNTSHVGRMVLTKAVLHDGRRDITNQYKFPEGTPEERRVLEKAEEFGCQREKSSLPKGDVDVEILNLDVRVGDDFDVTLQFNNRSDQRRSADVYITGTVVYYTGVPSGEVVFKTPKVKLEPQQSKEEKVSVRGVDYMHKLVEQGNIHFIATGKIKETGQIITAMKVITMHNPKLIVTVTGSPRVSEEMYVSVEFTNPFKFSLENVDLRMEGPGIMAFKHKLYSLISPGTSITWTETFSPRRAGSTKLMASLDCAALRQVYGETELTIQP